MITLKGTEITYPVTKELLDEVHELVWPPFEEDEDRSRPWDDPRFKSTDTYGWLKDLGWPIGGDPPVEPPRDPGDYGLVQSGGDYLYFGSRSQGTGAEPFRHQRVDTKDPNLRAFRNFAPEPFTTHAVPLLGSLYTTSLGGVPYRRLGRGENISSLISTGRFGGYTCLRLLRHLLPQARVLWYNQDSSCGLPTHSRNGYQWVVRAPRTSVDRRMGLSSDYGTKGPFVGSMYRAQVYDPGIKVLITLGHETMLVEQAADVHETLPFPQALRQVLAALTQALPSPPEPRASYWVVVPEGGSLNLRSVDAPATGEAIPDALVYGENFEAWQEPVLRDLQERQDGLLLLHGPPGTGKTSWIRKLPNLLPGKRVVILSQALVAALSGPEMFSLLLGQSTQGPMVLVVEDAESMLMVRDGADPHGSSLVSTLLNVTSGLLNDLLKVQVIATFNTDLTKVDPALLRPGRLIGERYFRKLTQAEGQRLADHVGVPHPSGEATAAEILCQQPLSPEPPKRKSVGFGRS